MSYMRSVYLQKNKKVFDVSSIDTKAFATSLGLANAPNIRFVKKVEAKKRGDTVCFLSPDVFYFIFMVTGRFVA